MKRKKKDYSEDQDKEGIRKRLDATIASVLMLAEVLTKDQKIKIEREDKAKFLIRLGFDNDEIAKIAGMAYGSVANIRMKFKGGKK